MFNCYFNILLCKHPDQDYFKTCLLYKRVHPAYYPKRQTVLVTVMKFKHRVHDLHSTANLEITENMLQSGYINASYRLQTHMIHAEVQLPSVPPLSLPQKSISSSSSSSLSTSSNDQLQSFRPNSSNLKQ